MAVFILTDVDERAQIEEALGHLVTTAKRLPSHFIEKRASLHETMNLLLDEWEAAG